jgi:ketosteroid isomerase-like protein
MLRKLGSALMILALIASAGCAKKVDLEGSKTALRTADEEWSKTVGNVDAFVGYVAADGSILPPNEAGVTGTDAVRQWATTMMGMPGFSVTWTPATVEVAQAGDVGYTAGTYQLQMQGPDGVPISDHGKYLTVWKKDAAGAWKVAQDMFNSDVPMAAAAPMDTTATPTK